MSKTILTGFEIFQLTRLMRGVTESIIEFFTALKISTHTPHARRDVRQRLCPRSQTISTHTPHARRDVPNNAWH